MDIPKLPAAAIAIAAIAALVPAQKGHDAYDTASPFDMVRWNGQLPEVKVQDTWYGLVAIDGVKTADLLTFAKKRCGDRWAKRFCEDLVFLLSEMRHAPGETVDLRLKDLQTGKLSTRKKVLMSAANRRAIHSARPRPAGMGRGGLRIPRGVPALGRRMSPFEMIRFRGYAPQVQLDGVWYGLLAIEGIAARDLLRFCRKAYGHKWLERFCEDLVSAMTAMGRQPGKTVDLLLKDLQTGKARTLPKVRLTAANRRAIRSAEPHEGAQPRRASRAKHTGDMTRCGYLAKRRFGGDGRSLTAREAEEDLDQLEWLIENRFSYANLKSYDYKTALDTIRQNLGTGIRIEDFHIQLRMVVAKFGDGHARVRGVHRHLARRSPQCAFAPFGKHVVAIDPATGDFVAPQHPLVEAIAGQPVQKVLGLLARIEAAGSPQFVHRNAVTNLVFLEYAVTAQDLTQEVSLTLRSIDGKSKTKKKIAMGRRPHMLGARRNTAPVAVLDGNVGYLRSAKMDSDRSFLEGLRKAMVELRGTKGLILDVRGNGGGSRLALRTLFPYFMGADDKPHVANVATYRLTPDDPVDFADGYLQDRFLYPKTFRGWNAEDQAAIAAATRRFKPKWTPKGGDFSALHYMLLRRPKGGAVFHYDKPVVVLIDSGCFSATDIFVGAFHGWRNVTLMGTETGGGSGRSQTTMLDHSELEVRLSTMVSYRPDGSLYDGVGIAPDVRAAPTLADLLGRTDSVLDKARRRLAQ